MARQPARRRRAPLTRAKPLRRTPLRQTARLKARTGALPPAPQLPLLPKPRQPVVVLHTMRTLPETCAPPPSLIKEPGARLKPSGVRATQKTRRRLPRALRQKLSLIQRN